MSARVNLAPEVHQVNQRNKQRKRLATTIASGIGITCGIIVGILILLLGAQKLTIGALDGQIKDRQNTLSQISDLKRAVTIQEHLKSWKDINQSKAQLSRFFDVLQEFAPQGISIQDLELSNENLLTVKVEAKNYQLATKFAKALEAANVEVGKNASAGSNPYFTDVQLDGVADDDRGTISFKLTTKMSSEVVNGN